MGTLSPLSGSPFSGNSLEQFARDLRRGSQSAAGACARLLERIEATRSKLGAFTHVDAARALAHAHALDGMLAARVDLGPLMGVPVVVKDLYSVDGMPTFAGSRVDISDLVAAPG